MSETEIKTQAEVLEPNWLNRVRKVVPLVKLASAKRRREADPLDDARRIAGQGATIALYTLLDLMLDDPSIEPRGGVGHETRRKASEDLLKFAAGEALAGAGPEDPWDEEETGG